MIASSVAKPAATSSRSPCQPARKPGAGLLLARPGTAITCSWNDVQRREQQRAAVGRDQPERHHDRRPERQQPPARHRRVAEHRQRELGVLVAERAQSVGRPGAGASARIEVPRDPGVAKSPVASAARARGLEAQDHDRFVGERRDLPEDPAGLELHRGRRRSDAGVPGAPRSTAAPARASRARPSRPAPRRLRSRDLERPGAHHGIGIRGGRHAEHSSGRRTARGAPRRAIQSGAERSIRSHASRRA